MAYVKTNWLDTIIQFPGRFIKSGETSTGVTLTPDPGAVTEAGTPVNATYLNKIEQGIADAHTKTSGISVPGNDCNNAIATGTYAYSNTTTNQPWAGLYGTLVVWVSDGDTYNGSTNWIYQLGTNTSNHAMRIRNKVNGGAWSNWFDVAVGDTDFMTYGGITTASGASINKSGNPGGARYHMYNGGGVAEWYAGQKSASDHHWNVTKNVAGVETDYFQVEANGNVNIPLGSLWINSGDIVLNGTHMAVTRLNGTLLEYWNGGAWQPVAGVKSIQKGVINLTGGTTSPVNVTIATVNAAKCSVNFPNYVDHASPTASVIRVQGYVSSSTNLALDFFGGSGDSVDLRWEVIEYY